MSSEFSVGLFECGDCGPCMYAWCCPTCAMASARSTLDNSDWLFNCVCLNLPILRWMSRSSYGIGDVNGCFEDCLLSYFCGCCVVNQIYQTVLKRGVPVNDGGKDFNVNEPLPFCDTSRCDMGTFFYACCCPGCALASAADKSVGLPWCSGFCFGNVCLIRNLARYQYRMNASICPGCECLDDIIFFCVPFSGLCFTVSLTFEANQKGNMSGGSKGYLVGYKQEKDKLTGVQPSQY